MKQLHVSAAQNLIPLFHYKWSISVLVRLILFDGNADVSALQQGIDAEYYSIERAAIWLLKAGHLRSRRGSSRWSRVEYCLTTSGWPLAGACEALVFELERQDVHQLMLTKWPLPVACAAESSNGRFNGIKSRLSTISSRALSQALKDLQASGLVARSVIDDSALRVDYHLTAGGRKLASMLENLGRLY